ncbi:hypothetical protein RF11_04069 [Thelohanellus kitauei]|uniref:Uncharacterized protein n=1 Tax=Thelohanellus kitauei TaxID=669202 RepID=A0A0C2JDI2_THEKT|nr:hypothetical protein RF11_04069 [Thelohanellus kitauei]
MPLRSHVLSRILKEKENRFLISLDIDPGVRLANHINTVLRASSRISVIHPRPHLEAYYRMLGKNISVSRTTNLLPPKTYEIANVTYFHIRTLEDFQWHEGNFKTSYTLTLDHQKNLQQ